MAIEGIVLRNVSDESSALTLRVDDKDTVTLGITLPVHAYDRDEDESYETTAYGAIEVKVKDLFSSVDLLRTAYLAEYEGSEGDTFYEDEGPQPSREFANEQELRDWERAAYGGQGN